MANNQRKQELRDLVERLNFASPPSEVKAAAEAVEDAYGNFICGVEFDELMSHLYDCNEDVVRAMGYDWYGDQ